MPNVTDRFITAATGSFADNAEMRIAAERELREMLDSVPVAASGTLDDYAKRLTLAARWDGGPRRFATAAAALVSVVIVGLCSYKLFTQRHAISYLLADGVEEIPDAVVARGATAREKSILFGPHSEFGSAVQMKALWDSDPGNLAYFFEYALYHKVEHGSLPADFLEITERLDPDNGFFPAVAAGFHADGAVKPIPPPKLKRGEKRPPLELEIKDAARLEESLALLQRAEGKPRWNDFGQDLVRERLAIVSRPRDILDHIVLADYMSTQSTLNDWILDLGWVYSAKADAHAKAGDAEGFRKLLAHWDAIAPDLFQPRYPSLLGGAVNQSGAAAVLRRLQEAAASLDMQDEAKRLQNQREQIDKMRNPPDGRDAAKVRQDHIEAHGSYRVSEASIAEDYRLPESTGVADAELEPGRRADYEMADRAGALVAWPVFVLAAVLAGAYRFRGGLLPRRLSRVLVRLIRPVDLLWIHGAGVVLPFVCLVLLSRLTPLGARDWNVTTHGMIVPAGQLLATIMLMLGLPVILARWRLGKSGDALGLRSNRSLIASPAMLLCILAFSLFGIGFLTNDPGEQAGRYYSFFDLDVTEEEGLRKIVFVNAAAALAIALTWWLSTGVRALFGRRRKTLRRVVLSRLVTPAYVSGMLVMALAIPAYHAAEKHWISRDRLMEITADTVPLDHYTHNIAAELQERLESILEASD